MQVTSDERREAAARLMDVRSQRCGRCVSFRGGGGGGGACLVYGARVSADERHVDSRSAITGEDLGCDNFMAPEADEEWVRALERAGRRPAPWR